MPLVRQYEDAAVLIAGGTSGVGLASALSFVDAGVRRMALLGRDADRGATARAAVESRCPSAEVVFLPTDAGDAGQVQEAVDTVHQRFGSLDAVISAVTGLYRPELLHEIPLEDLEGILVSQALPPMLVTRAALPHLRAQGGGSIVNIASDAAKVATPGETALGAAMASIVMFTRTAAVEGKRDGVRVNALTPSLIQGTTTAERVLSDGFSRTLFENAAAQAHLGVAEPEDLAAMVVYLAGPAAAKLTGQAISINGGISAA